MDQSRDLSGREQYRLVQLLDAPGYVKKAEASDLVGDDQLPSEVYAYPTKHLYPCHTPAATWLSTAFFLDKRAQFADADAQWIDERLAHYARYHGIEQSIKTLVDKHAAAQQVPEEVLGDEDYALVVKQGSETVRRYKMRNSGEVKSAAAYLHTHRDKFPYGVRRDWADKVLQKAASLGANLGEHADYIERQAGNGYCTTKTAVDLLRGRIVAARRGPEGVGEIKKAMAELANAMEKDQSRIHAPGMRVKLAAIIDDFDRSTNIWREYGEKVPRVEDALFELTTEKMASAAKDHISTLTGSIYAVADIEKLSFAQVESYLGDELANAVSENGVISATKCAEVIPTLDRGMAQLFDEMMESAGMAPAAKEASAGYGLSREYLLRMADDYRKAAGSF